MPAAAVAFNINLRRNAPRSLVVMASSRGVHSRRGPRAPPTGRCADMAGVARPVEI
jgi:hypothetical protein